MPRHEPAGPDRLAVPCRRTQLHAIIPINDSLAWQRRMLETHKQVACPGCGLYVVYVPRLGR